MQGYISIKKIKYIVMVMCMMCCTILGGKFVHAEGATQSGVFECQEGTVGWKLTLDGNLVLTGKGTISKIDFGELNRSTVKHVYCDSNSNISFVYSMSFEEAFMGMSNVEDIDLSLLSGYVGNADRMFSGCSKLVSLNMSSMYFSTCEYNTHITNANGLDVWKFGINMEDMFKECNSLKKIYATEGCLGGLPKAGSGYQWEDSKGNVLENNNFRNTCSVSALTFLQDRN